jgi:nitrate reductase NapAB chaperone NapD
MIISSSVIHGMNEKTSEIFNDLKKLIGRDVVAKMR